MPVVGGVKRSRRSFPWLARLGLVVMVFGLLSDMVEHSLVDHTGETVVAGFPIAQHLAHLVVLAGMVLVLTGVIADGVRQQGRPHRPRREVSNAVR
jgi:hypothetical protein